MLCLVIWRFVSPRSRRKAICFSMNRDEKRMRKTRTWRDQVKCVQYNADLCLKERAVSFFSFKIKQQRRRITYLSVIRAPGSQLVVRKIGTSNDDISYPKPVAYKELKYTFIKDQYKVEETRVEDQQRGQVGGKWFRRAMSG